MGTLVFRIVQPGDPPFANQSMLDACIDPQFSGVFPDDPALGIYPERKPSQCDLNQLPSNPKSSKPSEPPTTT